MKTTIRLAPARLTGTQCTPASVLVIDDDQHFRNLARNLLEPAGILLLEAPDARRGLELLTQLRPVDVVIVDMVMPDEDGIQALRRIRTVARDSRVVAVSGAYAANLYLDMSSKLGADAILPKSQIERLRPLVEQLLEGRG